MTQTVLVAGNALVLLAMYFVWRTGRLARKRTRGTFLRHVRAVSTLVGLLIVGLISVAALPLHAKSNIVVVWMHAFAVGTTFIVFGMIIAERVHALYSGTLHDECRRDMHELFGKIFFMLIPIASLTGLLLAGVI